MHSGGEAFVIAGIVASIGLVLFFIFGIPLIRRLGESAGGLYTAGGRAIRVHPEYSVAEARVKKGRYAEAVAEYREVIAKFPDDIYAHVKIADIAIEHLNDLPLAELELNSAFAKAARPEAISMTAHKLADFYQLSLHDPARAAEAMQQLAAKVPGTKEAHRAEERLAILRQAGNAAPPSKITFRQTNEETLRQRRGY